MKRWALAAVAASLSVGVWDVARPAAASRTVWDGVFSQEQATRGRAIYRQSCAGCHGDDLGGGSAAPALAGESFAFLFNDATVGELLTRVRTMPPENASGLPGQSYRDIVAFLLSANAYPAGAAELDADVETLKQILITKARPDLARPIDRPRPRS